MRNFLYSRRKSFDYAFSGIFYVLRTQRNAWIHLTITILVCLAGFLFKLTSIEWMILVICIAVVWITEFLNTAVEAVVDLVQVNNHPIAKISKDVAAAAVLIAATTAVLVGMILFGPKVINLIR